MDDLQIHFLQLKHFQVTAETLCNASAIERWCWFLCNAGNDCSDTRSVVGIRYQSQSTARCRGAHFVCSTGGYRDR
ncbi:MAG: hypothetical protein ACKPJD_28630 [Planctomycetaceae bacterium]